MTELTTEAVSQALIDAAWPEAKTDSCGRLMSEGFTVHVVPVTHEDRIGVCWSTIATGWAEDRRFQYTVLGYCAEALARAGYQAEIMAELIGPTLIVWVEGGF